MSALSYNQIHQGDLVSVIIEADGHRVQGTVGDVLSGHDHPHGPEVRLTDGRVGRVQEVISAGNPSSISFTQSHHNNTPVPDPQNWQAHTSFPSGHPSSQTHHNPVPDPQNWQAHTTFPSGHPSAHSPHPQPHHTHYRPQAPIRDDSPHIPPEERSEQVEYLQSYEDSRPESQDDRNQAMLQREFPSIDSSLIAAIYGDSKSLSATRKMLEELKD
jgi:uncharacterized repeat protein (TIGR03833 family)